MKKSLLFFLWLAMSLLFINSTSAQFRVVGYVAARGALPGDINLVDFSKITHLNIAFINPDSAGNLVIPAQFEVLVSKARENKVKVLVSMGGGSHNPYYARLLTDAYRPSLVQKLIQLATKHSLDGIDVDLEGEAIDSNYNSLIADLSTALKPLNKLLTAAFASWNAAILPDDALEKFDFINIMSYDQTGPWRPSQPGPHSTFAKAEEDIGYWLTTRGFPKHRINLGLPFYGHCFGTKYGESMSFRDIISNFADAAQNDMVVPETGGAIYYNGIPTIKSKTELVLKNTGGVMIWQLLQDAPGDKSLLKAIHQTINQAE